MRNAVKIALLMFATLTLSNCGFEQVDTGYRGIHTRFGEVRGEPLPEGLHFYNPFTSNIVEYQVREETWESETPIFTKDTQNVVVTFAVTFYPDPKLVTKLYQEIGYTEDLVEKIIKPVALGSIKDSIGNVIADDLVSMREEVTKKALAEVKENLARRSVIVTDLQFTNLDFDDAYEKAVEEKVVAIQQAQKAKNETVKVREEGLQIEIEATAKAKAMQIQTQALSQSKTLVEYEAVKKWDGKLPQYILGGNGATPFINLTKLGKSNE